MSREDMAEIKRFEKTLKECTATEEKFIKFSQDAGVMDKNGKFIDPYKDPDYVPQLYGLL